MVDSKQIEIKIRTKFLALHIDEYLNWNEHVYNVFSKVTSGMYTLSKISFNCNQATLIAMYFAHIHSHSIYFGLCSI